MKSSKRNYWRLPATPASYFLPKMTLTPPNTVIGAPGAKKVLLRTGNSVSPSKVIGPKGCAVNFPLLSYGVVASCPAV